MRRHLFLCLAIICFAGRLFPQTPLWQWPIQIASPGNEQGLDMCNAPGGDVYICGSYDGNLGVIFGVPFLSPGQKDGFVARYSSTGTLQWVIRIGGSNDEEVKGIAVDGSGNIIVTGYFEGTTDFDPGLFSTFNLTSSGAKDGFVAKYTSSGALVWAVRFGG